MDRRQQQIDPHHLECQTRLYLPAFMCFSTFLLMRTTGEWWVRPRSPSLPPFCHPFYGIEFKAFRMTRDTSHTTSTAHLRDTSLQEIAPDFPRRMYWTCAELSQAHLASYQYMLVPFLPTFRSSPVFPRLSHDLSYSNAPDSHSQTCWT